MRRRLLIVVAGAAVALLAVAEAGARVRTVKTPERDVSATPNLAEGEATVAYNPRNRRNVSDRRYTGGGWYDPYDIFARVVRVRRDGSLDPGRTLRVTRHSQLPSTGHRGHMPSEYLGIAAKGSRALGVAWEAMKGRYPDDVYKSVPLREFGR